MEKDKKLFWIGIRESEIINTNNIFDGSITIFGSNKGSNYSFERDNHIRINYNQDNNALNAFINRTALRLLENYPQCQFLLYYPMEVALYDTCILEHTICINPSSLTDLLENKIYTRLWLSDSVPMLPFSSFMGTELNYDNLSAIFKNNNQFVIQGTFSCGGSATWLVSCKEDINSIVPFLLPYNMYSVTQYIKNNVSVNVHLIIYEKEILFFPPSVQIINIEHYNLCYGGADYFMTEQLPGHIIDKLKEYANIIGQKLQASQYRGICGIDFLTTADEVYFMEINARFQSSSFLLNDTLKKYQLPSLQELNMDAFSHSSSSYKISSALQVNRSFYNFSYTRKNYKKMKYIWESAEACPEVEYCVDDCIDWDMPMEEDTYLYKLVFNTNIASLAPGYSCRLYNGFRLDFGLLNKTPWDKQGMRLKVLLLNQGIRISENALVQLDKSGGPNYQMFYAIDLFIENRVLINVPYKVKLSEISAFEIQYKNNMYWLAYYGDIIAQVSVRTTDPIADRITQRGIPYSDISYLGVDRLRIHNRGGCYFKDHDIGCKFCDIEKQCLPYRFEDIKEVIDTYLDIEFVRHYLVGGGSQQPDSNFDECLNIVKYIHQLNKKNIYLMSIPPMDCNVLIDLKNAGVTEVSFNLEVFDRQLAVQYMPGKGRIPLSRYESAFKKATELWGKSGNVRSALIIGLEPLESTLNGVEYLCRQGVAPILSLFKPSDQMEDFFSPDSREVLFIWEKAEEICLKYGISLGPSCHYCEDNVLKITIDDKWV